MTFDAFFRQATTPPGEALRSPHAYQRRLACGPEADPAKPETMIAGRPCESLLINIPT